jgi:hypothetical protein
MIGVVIHAGRVSEEEETLRDPNAPNDSFARPFKSFRPVPMMASMGSPGIFSVLRAWPSSVMVFFSLSIHFHLAKSALA